MLKIVGDTPMLVHRLRPQKEPNQQNDPVECFPKGIPPRDTRGYYIEILH